MPMKIKEIQIRQFGRFDDWKLALPEEQLIAIHGQNEAGKSTLRQIILSVLFQFPKKPILDTYLRQKDTRLTKGLLFLSLSDGRSLYAERSTHEKDMKIRLENGQDLPSEELLESFGGVDRSLYEDVFCFDLDGLQGLDELGAADLNQWLFNASMPGADSIMRLEQSLQKKRDELFKPSGRKPLINAALTEIERSRQSLIKWEKELDHYDALKTKHAELIKEGEQLEAEFKKFSQQKDQFLRYYSLQPLIIDYNTALEEKKALPAVDTFPEQGIERLERLLTERLTLDGQQVQMHNRLNQVNERLEQLSFTTEQEAFYEKNLSRLIESKPLYDQHQSKKKELTDKKYQTDEMGQRLLNKLGAEWSVESVKQASVGIEASNNLKHLTEEITEVIRLADHTEKELESKQQGIQERDRSLKEKTAQLLSDVRRQECEAAAALTGGSIQKEADRKNLLFKKDLLQKNIDSEKRWNKTSQISGTVLLLATIFSFFLLRRTLPPEGIMFLAVCGVMISAGLLAGPRLIFRRSGLREQLIEVNDQLDHFSEGLEDPDSKSREASWLLERDNHFRLEAEMEKNLLNNEKKSYEQAIAEWDKLQLAKEMIEDKFKEWKKTYHFQPETEIKWLPDVYQHVEAIKENLFESEQISAQIDQLDAAIQQFEMLVQTYSESLQISPPDFYDLKKALKEFEERKLERKQRAEQQEELSLDAREMTAQIAAINEAINELFLQSEAANEEDFRKKAEHYRKQQNISRQLAELQRQMRHIVPDEAFIDKCYVWLEQQTWRGFSQEFLIEKEERLKSQMNTVKKSQLEIEAEIRALEKDQSYRDLRYTFEAQQSEINDLSRQWAVCQTSLTLLQQTKEAYRREKLPNIIKDAGRFFSAMTNGAYQDIKIAENGTFVVVHSTGKVFYINELSRGTHEQLYLSIRLALTQAIGINEKLPIIIDDGLVNTDQLRYQSIMRVLKEVSLEHQIIFLTCHPERLTDFTESQKVGLE